MASLATDKCLGHVQDAKAAEKAAKKAKAAAKEADRKAQEKAGPSDKKKKAKDEAEAKKVYPVRPVSAVITSVGLCRKRCV